MNNEKEPNIIEQPSRYKLRFFGDSCVVPQFIFKHWQHLALFFALILKKGIVITEAPYQAD